MSFYQNYSDYAKDHLATEDCPVCRGRGIVDEEECEVCEGEGKVTERQYRDYCKDQEEQLCGR